MEAVYCGPAPTPATLMAMWRFDAAALGLCALLLAVHLRVRRAERSSALAGSLVVLALLFLSPLCALSAALFSARAAHHLLLVAVAAPLIALAFPMRGRPAIAIGWLALLHGFVFWLWHVPSLYAAGIGNPALYWLMQGSLLATGFWLWRRVFDLRETAGGVLLALLGTTLQMGMLGALLTFATSPLYGPHLLTTAPFGLSPREDQQLAGLVMWVPAALPYLAAALWRCWPMLAAGGRPRVSPWSG